MQSARNARQAQGAAKTEPASTTPSVAGSPSPAKDRGGASSTDPTANPASVGSESSLNEQATAGAAAGSTSFSSLDGAVQRVRQPFDHVEDITSILKTGFPLLTLALETMVDQIAMRMKLMPEEDICRQLNYLHADGMMVCIQWLLWVRS